MSNLLAIFRYTFVEVVVIYFIIPRLDCSNGFFLLGRTIFGAEQLATSTEPGVFSCFAEREQILIGWGSRSDPIPQRRSC